MSRIWRNGTALAAALLACGNWYTFALLASTDGTDARAAVAVTLAGAADPADATLGLAASNTDAVKAVAVPNTHTTRTMLRLTSLPPVRRTPHAAGRILSPLTQSAQPGNPRIPTQTRRPGERGAILALRGARAVRIQRSQRSVETIRTEWHKRNTDALANAPVPALDATFFTARTNLSWGKMLAQRTAPGDIEKARELLTSAQTIAAERGYSNVERRSARALQALD